MEYLSLTQQDVGKTTDNGKTSAMNILVVNENQEVTNSLVRFLSEKGYAPLGVYSGKDALEALKFNALQIAIIDFKQPDIDGITLLEAIKAVNKQIIVIVISGDATIDTTSKCIKSGAYDFISKPFDFVHLELILERALEKKEVAAKLKRSRIRNLLIAASLCLSALLGYSLL